MSDLVNAISGKDGSAVAGETTLEITEWTYEPSIAAPKYASNLTQGHKVAVAAVQDGSGTITCPVTASGLVLNLGEVVDLALYGPINVSLTALITSHPITVDVNDGNPTMIAYSFEPRSKPVFSAGSSS